MATKTVETAKNMPPDMSTTTESPNNNSDQQGATSFDNSSSNNSGPSRPHGVKRTTSTSSTISYASAGTNDRIDGPVLIYHESARSIVFRDHMRRAVKKEQQEGFSESTNRTVTHAYATELLDARRDAMEYTPPEDMIHNNDDDSHGADDENGGDMDPTPLEFRNSDVSCISNCFQPSITPLPKLELGQGDQLDALLQSATGRDGDVDPHWTAAEKEVVDLFGRQKAVVKTVKNTDWTAFLHRFQIPKNQYDRCLPLHYDKPPHEGGHPFNSFLTSVSLLPPYGQKMRAYGSPTTFTAGVVFGLPETHYIQDTTCVSEDYAAAATRTWSWPSGYSAKTEFNRDSHGELINGREEALVNFDELRQFNVDYLTKDEHMIAGRLVKALKVVPYNEVLVRVGGHGRIVGGRDVASSEPRIDGSKDGRSFESGLGLPIALFVRTATYGHLISLIRTRARLIHVWGESQIKNIPLLLITPESGVRVLTKRLEALLLKNASQRLNPFQNPTIAHKTTIGSQGDELEQKLEELLDLDDSEIRKLLTPEECARLAGGFGATDDSVASLLRDAMMADKAHHREHKNDKNAGESHILQDIVNEGLTAAVRSGDYYTSRQLLILYSLVASTETDDEEEEEKADEEPETAAQKFLNDGPGIPELKGSMNTLSKNLNPPPPPPLDTDRLRGATNSDGLLSVLGAAQVLKAMQDGSAKRRTDEVILALEEWCEYGESSMAFRLASWRDQRGAQADLKIAMERDSSFMAFLSNKAVSNRKAFVSQLKQVTQSTDFSDVRFLSAILAILDRMHSPCLRLELLQYVLGLDNRYSVAHVARSVELARTCLGLGGR